MNLNKKKLFFYLKIIWTLSLSYFLYVYFSKNFNQIYLLSKQLPIENIILAILFLVFGKILLSYNVCLALKRIGTNFPFFKCFHIYNTTQLAKYIPGSVWQWVGRGGIYQQEGLKYKQIKDSLLYEIVWLICGAFSVGIITICVSDFHFINTLISSIIPEDIRPLVLCISALTLLFALLLKRFHKSFSVVFKYRPTAIIALIHFLIWITLGTSYWFTLSPYANSISLVFVIGVYAISFVIGFLVPFAPAGLGIREAVLVAAMTPFMDVDTAIWAATINRILYSLSEIFLVISSYSILFFCKILDYKQRRL